jgi:hypothetical protein
LFKIKMLLFVILLLLSKVVKEIFIECLVMSKQDMGIMTLVKIWTYVDHCNDVLHNVWVTKPSSRIKYATFQFYEKSYMLYKCCTLIGCLSWVLRMHLLVIAQDVKK